MQRSAYATQLAMMRGVLNLQQALLLQCAAFSLVAGRDAMNGRSFYSGRLIRGEVPLLRVHARSGTDSWLYIDYMIIIV